MKTFLFAVSFFVCAGTPLIGHEDARSRTPGLDWAGPPEGRSGIAPGGCVWEEVEPSTPAPVKETEDASPRAQILFEPTRFVLRCTTGLAVIYIESGEVEIPEGVLPSDVADAFAAFLATASPDTHRRIFAVPDSERDRATPPDRSRGK